MNAIVANQCHPTMLHIYTDGDGYFQDDNAPIHRARNGLRNLPPLSPDLNPTEHAWDEFEQCISHHDLLFTSLHRLCEIIIVMY